MLRSIHVSYFASLIQFCDEKVVASGSSCDAFFFPSPSPPPPPLPSFLQATYHLLFHTVIPRTENRRREGKEEGKEDGLNHCLPGDLVDSSAFLCGGIKGNNKPYLSSCLWLWGMS